MLQELFRIPGINLPIYGYGFMLVVGYLCALALAKFLARRSRIDPELFATAGIIALLSGVVGARLSHVLENWPTYSRADLSFLQNLWNAVNIREGGLTFYGGLILGTVCTLAYGLYKRVPVRVGMDVMAPAIMVGLAFGRIGCFLNGCCYGAECHAPYAVSFPYYSSAYQDRVDRNEVEPPAQLVVPTRSGGNRLLTPDEIRRDPALSAVARAEHSRPLHPAQLYSAIDAFLAAAVLVAYFTIPHAPGRVFALMLLLMAPARFLTELVRSEPPVMWVGPLGLSFSMALSILFVVAGTLLWFAFGKAGSRDEWTAQTTGTPLPA